MDLYFIYLYIYIYISNCYGVLYTVVGQYN